MRIYFFVPLVIMKTGFTLFLYSRYYDSQLYFRDEHALILFLVSIHWVFLTDYYSVLLLFSIKPIMFAIMYNRYSSNHNIISLFGVSLVVELIMTTVGLFPYIYWDPKETLIAIGWNLTFTIPVAGFIIWMESTRYNMEPFKRIMSVFLICCVLMVYNNYSLFSLMAPSDISNDSLKNESLKNFALDIEVQNLEINNTKGGFSFNFEFPDVGGYIRDRFYDVGGYIKYRFFPPWEWRTLIFLMWLANLACIRFWIVVFQPLSIVDLGF